MKWQRIAIATVMVVAVLAAIALVAVCKRKLRTNWLGHIASLLVSKRRIRAFRPNKEIPALKDYSHEQHENDDIHGTRRTFGRIARIAGGDCIDRNQ
jgi:HAMP domain-containing protein